MTEERLSFQAEVSRLLDIVAHSLYSEKEVFLRELVSNASDACDRLRYAALTQPELSADDPALKVRLIVDKDARTLTVADNGIGMNREDLVENLGTIARSGTGAFLRQLSGDAKKDVSLIGQFGVGFYSAFMVADRVTVTTRKAGESQGWRWESDGKGEFTVGEAADAARGTRVTLHLRDGDDEYLEEHRLSAIVRKYSDHIALPILFGEGDEAKTLNSASALWMRSKSEVTAEQYKEFYHHVGHAFDDPWLTLHWRAEGAIEYTNLLFVPTSKPFDLFDPKRAHRVKLYVRRVFITEGAEGLLPPYLRFLKGVVDSEDLPLNISREMLQHNPMLAKIRSGIVRRVLSELNRKANDAESKEAYEGFWENFGAVLKEGVYDDYEHRDDLLKLMRFRTTAGDGLVSLEEYVGRMKEGQEAIFTISGDDIDSLLKSPQLEGFRAKGVEVLLLTDAVDEFWVPAVGAYKEKPFKSVTRGGAELGKIKAADKPEDKPEETPAEGGLTDLLALLKLALGEEVKDVRKSERLTDSAVCLVADDNDMDMHLERLLKQHKQLGMGMGPSKRILEVNPGHPLIKRLGELATREGAATGLDDAAWLLLDQARIVEGEPLPDPAAFARRLASVMARGVSL
ncbi:molecular chaperone HtpG [Azospirillum sp. RWY-5-1]|uniref:Chaperone protein HtpG n=1 Tax=Azospirillum oleiclasticum TaxID=2735135 RepID=A0ABX2TK78_9PROT|nr:molecular chaperone HtpG [Azospirillum oleiclasticum]NYZ16013.1 molecular chaperone HtpG [Azospirillum oleiclasticum]NYZ23508.1 molecular chaperone HtpG [Azospirillum oleiclasticum]